MRRRTIGVAAALLLLALPGVRVGGAPRAEAGAAQLVDAMVVLKRQADFTTLPAGRRAARRQALVQLLRATATADQAPLVNLLQRLQPSGLVGTVQPFWVQNALEVEATPAVLQRLAALPRVREVRPILTLSAPPAPAAAASAPDEANIGLVGAPLLWDLGLRGQGVVVANMDTGVDVGHADLAGSWRGGSNSWLDPYGQHPTTPTDLSGHGTWTMGVMVGGSAGGSAIGVAPGARWIAAKIFDDHGSATSAKIHQAFQWLLDPDGNPATADAPDVVNGSWSLGAPGCNLEFQQDLRALRAAGIVPVFAAGNSGPNPGTGYSPANNPEALAVGSTDLLDLIDPSSSRGPSACDGGTFPDLTAPGVDIRTTDLFGLYTSQTGTSLAAPHVSGALALLLSALPDTSADRQEAAVELADLDLGPAGPDDTYGYGRLDVRAAYTWLTSTPDFTVVASPDSASTAPGGGVSYTVTVGSVGGFVSDVGLSVAGLAPAQGTATLTPSTITGGSGTATLAVTTAAGLVPGTYTLTVTGTGGGATHTARTSLVVLPPPDFTLTAVPASTSTPPGGTATYVVSVSATGGFAGDVALTLGGLAPAQGTATFTPAVVAGGSGNSTLAATTSATLAPGSYPLTVTGTSGGLVHTTTTTLVVAAPPDFGLAVNPSSRTVTRGVTTTFTIAVSARGGFNGNVTLSVAGLPTGTTATFTPAVPRAPGSSTVTVRTGATSPRGTYTLTFTGRNGSLVHTATATLTLR